MNLTEKRKQQFIDELKNFGGSKGNGSLRSTLGWELDFYWKVQGILISEGKIFAGRGRGGSVSLTDIVVEREIQPIEPIIRERERDLYGPIKESVEKNWIQRFAMDNVLVEETHSRGSKLTGGTFTRPDLTAVGTRSYAYLPKRLEVITFEVKPSDAVGVLGVLEAIAHREAAHRSYVIFSASSQKFEAAPEAERLIELAQKYGVGVVSAEKPNDVESWEIQVDAIRHEPDPGRLDRFLKDLPNEEMKHQLSKWKG